MDARTLLREIFQSARSDLRRIIEDVIDLGFPVNFSDPNNHFGLLHYAAAGNAKSVADLVLAIDGLNPLSKDTNGRYASDVAFEIGNSPELAARLQRFEREYAAARKIPYKQAGLDLAPRPA